MTKSTEFLCVLNEVAIGETLVVKEIGQFLLCSFFASYFISFSEKETKKETKEEHEAEMEINSILKKSPGKKSQPLFSVSF